MYYDPPHQASPPRPRLSAQGHAALLAGLLMLLVFAVSSFVLKDVSLRGEELRAGVLSQTTVSASLASLPTPDGETFAHGVDLPIPPLVVAIGLMFLLVLGSLVALVLVACGQFCYTRFCAPRLRRTALADQ